MNETRSGRQILFTPGPLTTSPSVRAAMDLDLGSRTADFTTATAEVCGAIAEFMQCGERYAVTPLQGSGTFAVEAMLSTLVQRDLHHVLIPVNGDYSERMAQICRIHALKHTVIIMEACRPIDIAAIDVALSDDPSITHIAVVHFETGLGVLNDVNRLAAIGAGRGCRLLVDAISTAGALSIDFSAGAIEAVALSANKCLHGVAGAAFVLTKVTALSTDDVAPSLALDLRAQWRGIARNGQWRFTPPVQVILALRQALREHSAAGGVAARLARYQRLADRLLRALAQLGIVPVIDERFRAPMITTFTLPAQAPLTAAELMLKLEAAGLTIYPSRLEDSRSFRLGCMGDINDADIDRVSQAIASILRDSATTMKVPHSPDRECATI